MPKKSLNPLDRHSKINDYILSHNFHLIDVSMSQPVVMSLVYGFHAVSSPNIIVKTQTVKEGNWDYPHHVVVGAEIAPITLEQGVAFFNSDFYDWIITTIEGKPSRRRNLMLVQYSQVGIGSLASTGSNVITASTFVQTTNPFQLTMKFDAQPFADLVSRVPVRAWMLMNTLPVEYRAASDFSAASSEVSLAQLTIQPHRIVEFNTGI